MKEYQQQLINEHMKSDELYCCYCMEPQGEKYHCCQENHFMKFSDFDDETKKEFIAWELEEYEKWAENQRALAWELEEHEKWVSKQETIAWESEEYERLAAKQGALS
jgi:CRISPR/Cas system CMR-associated protein Cmr3 (group 5 of RAMP superfamily)